MTAFLSWIDFSAAQRERMRRVVDLFQERGTVDELGLGTLRDAFSWALFPGTSTIQTRLRYFLFVPWIYRRLEREGVPQRKVAKRARDAELQLAEELAELDDPRGAFGQAAGRALKRLPSSVYWGGLQSWGIFRADLTLEQYHQSFDELHRVRRNVPQPDDAGVAPELQETWHRALPEPPADFPVGATFQLTAEEADYLRGRIESTCGGSLLAGLATGGGHTDVAFPWEYPDLASVPEPGRKHLDLARRFSFVMHGAGLLYNLMLAEICGRSDRETLQQKYRQRLDDWASSDEREELGRWQPDELWKFMSERQAHVTPNTRKFITEWMRVAATRDPASIVDDNEARALVRWRETTMKGQRARFTNPRALDQWGGATGANRLDYRWRAVQTLLNDLHDGLGRELENHAGRPGT